MTNRAQLGMAMFLISGALFFFLLVPACVYFHELPALPAPYGWVLTGALLAASVCIWRKWRWAAVALGALFIGGVVGTSLAMLTAILAVFILAGVIALALAPSSGLRALSLYWYFFTAVWLVIFAVAGRA